jgi:hypothetical protein
VSCLRVLILLLALMGQAASQGGTMPATIQEVKAQHEKRFLAMPGVVSVGIGRGADGKPVIVVGLDRPRPETVKQLPQSLDGHPVRVDIIGPVKAQ